MSKTPNPFKGLNLNLENPHAEVVFEVSTGVFVRATFNLSPHVGRLSRGTIGIWDSATGRYKQLIQNGTHSFRNAVTKDLIIPTPKEGESQSEVLERTTRQAAAKLFNEFRPLILTSVRDDKDLQNHSLGQLLELYCADYIADRSSSSGMRKVYRSQLENLANFLGEKPLKEIRKKDFVSFSKIHKGENSSEYISNLQRFLTDTAFRIGTAPPCQKAFDSYFNSIKKGKKSTDANIVADVLPKEFEDKLDKGCWNNLGNPFWGAAVIGKEGGLDAKTLCSLRIKNILLGDTAEEVYIIHQRNKPNSYTTDYSFALTPFGASYISEYLTFLKETFSPERLEANKYLFSVDDTGDIPLNTKDVSSFIRNSLSRFLFGYVGRVLLENGTTISMGLELLRRTRKKHIIEDCRFDDDFNAIIFLLHQSLSRSVQANNYRCFTDVYGRKLLYKRLAQDRHGCRPPSAPKKFTRMSNTVRGDIRELRFPAKQNACPGRDQVITLTVEGLEPGDMVEVLGSEGCYVWFD